MRGMREFLYQIFIHQWEKKLGIVMIVIVVLATILRVLFATTAGSTLARNSATGVLRYVAIGDSYTIGESVNVRDNFPAQLSTALTKGGMPSLMVANPSRTGFTTREVIAVELPVLERSKPDAATLLIGVNDWVVGVSPEEFKANLDIILDRMLTAIPEKRIVVITIPDFAATPTGKIYAVGRGGHSGIQHFNEIIMHEAGVRNLPVVDIFALSGTLGVIGGYVAFDGLHPSATAYAKWVELILPIAKATFSQK